MKVREFLERNPRRIVTARTQTPIQEAMAVLLENRIGCLPVVDDGHNIMGIIRNRKNSSASFHLCLQIVAAKEVKQFRTKKMMIGAVKKPAVWSVHSDEIF